MDQRWCMPSLDKQAYHRCEDVSGQMRCGCDQGLVRERILHPGEQLQGGRQTMVHKWCIGPGCLRAWGPPYE